ncbi:pilus assembly protein N-terminal domain-containing protein [Sulfurimonas autotrophica]|uniref:Type II and III secretion system protein n=1 Tax=Sulfurimonas autotrophica (strain ATCC BAA-671 / DSM 16294 / JCM 11897 / OK10) TaxID=563040 RepID=E0UQM4_SULAO|nr:pilus assembly protein N-terminal domain-containing protein [Sulfurimonas autotrophica]ADN09896.1 type II and III secretion system protein [Sulfurimonas autotrophica DSM 16294]
MKKILLLLGICLSLLANDILVFNNEYQVLPLQKKIKRLIIGNKETINVSLLDAVSAKGTLLKIFGKKTGNTSILVIYTDNSIQNYHVYVNENLGYIQKMINIIEPNLRLSKVGNDSTVIAGVFKDPHDKKRIYEILQKGGINTEKLMDLTKTQKVNKMIRTKLYLIAVDNQKAKDLGGVTGLSFFNKYVNATANAAAANSATFSGFLLDNLGNFTTSTGNSVLATLNFLQTKGITNILDDTVLITTEDKNATFRVGGELYIPTGITQNVGTAPTIQVEAKEYGLKLTLTSKFMQTNGYMHINVDIQDSAIDANIAHNVSLGDGISIPSFVSKNIKTNVVVKSEQVIALGGRLHSENSKSEEKVPLFGDIPILGELFKHKIENLGTTDLIFLLVPEIVDANEDIDDTDFYRNFKNSSNILHAKVTDVPKEEAADRKTTEQTAEITQHSETNATLITPVIIEEENTKETNSQTQPPENIQEITLELPQEEPTPTLQTYAVNAQKIFLREKPVNGKRVNVWKGGHKFTSDESRKVDGITWLKVKQDCYATCKELKKDLWISQKYIRIL